MGFIVDYSSEECQWSTERYQLSIRNVCCVLERHHPSSTLRWGQTGPRRWTVR